MTVFIETSDYGVAYDLATVECIGSLVSWPSAGAHGFRCLRANEDTSPTALSRGDTRIWYVSDPNGRSPHGHTSVKRTIGELIAFREDLIQRWSAARKARYAGADT